MIDLSTIDNIVNNNAVNFAKLVTIFDMKSNIEKSSILSLTDVYKSQKEAVSLFKDYGFDLTDFLNVVYEEANRELYIDSITLEKIKSVYSDRIFRVINSNINILLSKHSKNARTALLRNKANKQQDLIKYSHKTVFDASGRQISLVDKFRKDLRKAMIDYVNDVIVVSAYKEGKKTGYTIKDNGEIYKEFSISEYIKNPQIKNSIFHPNVQSLAHIEE